MAIASLARRFHVATDTFYNHVYYHESIAVQAHREGWEKGLRGDDLAQFTSERTAHPPADYNAKAIEKARTLTAQRKIRGKFAGWVAALVWAVSGIYFFLTTPISFFSLAALEYFLIGTFATKFLIGGITHIIYGLLHPLRLLIISASEPLIIPIVGEIIPSVFILAARLIFGAIIFTSESAVTFLIAHGIIHYI